MPAGTITKKATVAPWIATLRRLYLLHAAISHREISVSELYDRPEIAAVGQTRRQWNRNLQELKSLGAPLVYRQSAVDAHYRYSEKWNFWKAVRESVNR